MLLVLQAFLRSVHVFSFSTILTNIHDEVMVELFSGRILRVPIAGRLRCDLLHAFRRFLWSYRRVVDLWWYISNVYHKIFESKFALDNRGICLQALIGFLLTSTRCSGSDQGPIGGFAGNLLHLFSSWLVFHSTTSNFMVKIMNLYV
jgi:hypothetical protein